MQLTVNLESHSQLMWFNVVETDRQVEIIGQLPGLVSGILSPGNKPNINLIYHRLISFILTNIIHSWSALAERCLKQHDWLT